MALTSSLRRRRTVEDGVRQLACTLLMLALALGACTIDRNRTLVLGRATVLPLRTGATAMVGDRVLRVGEVQACPDLAVVLSGGEFDRRVDVRLVNERGETVGRGIYSLGGFVRVTAACAPATVATRIELRLVVVDPNG
jgi:hypothetical protein